MALDILYDIEKSKRKFSCVRKNLWKRIYIYVFLSSVKLKPLVVSAVRASVYYQDGCLWVNCVWWTCHMKSGGLRHFTIAKRIKISSFNTTKSIILILFIYFFYFISFFLLSLLFIINISSQQNVNWRWNIFKIKLLNKKMRRKKNKNIYWWFINFFISILLFYFILFLNYFIY